MFPRHLPGIILGRFWIDFSGRFASPGMDLALFSGHCDDSEEHDDIREDLWEYHGVPPEVARKLPVIAIPCALSCWFFPHVQAM